MWQPIEKIRLCLSLGLMAALAVLSVWAAPGNGGGSMDVPADIKAVLENTEPLRFSRGGRLPLYVWRVMDSLAGLSDTQAERVIRLLDERGIAVAQSWNYGRKEKSLEEGLRIGAIQQGLGLRVNVNATACLYSFFNGDERTFHVDSQGRKFYDGSFSPRRKMGCPFALKFRYPAIRERLEYFLRGYKQRGIKIDFIFADWEIDGPIEWNDAWSNSRRCRRCREHIRNIDDFREFQKQLRLIRSDMQRTVFVETVKRYFPGALVGNYGVYPHDGYRYWYDYYEKFVPGAPYKADGRAKYREWFPEFGLTGYNCAMPVVYTWYPTFNWYDFANPDYRWFYNMLLVATNACKSTPADVPIVSFVHWTTTSPPKNPDPAVKQFSREMYQELLWHMLLRGVDGFFLWCLKSELAAEVEAVHQVYADALKYRDFLDRGEPVTFQVPREPGPVVSGLKLGRRLLLRRTDFDDTAGDVELEVGGKKVVVPRFPGQCRVVELK